MLKVGISWGVHIWLAKNTTRRMKRTSKLFTETVVTRRSGAPSVFYISKSINTVMPWMRTHGLFASIPIYPRSGLISGACTRAVTTRLEMPSMPTRGLQSSTQEMVQSLSDCICSSTLRPRAPSYPLLLLRKMSILLPMQVWLLRRASVDFRFYTSTTADVLSIAPNPVNQEARSPITLISVLQKHRLHHSEEALHPLLSLTKAVTPLLTPS